MTPAYAPMCMVMTPAYAWRQVHDIHKYPNISRYSDFRKHLFWGRVSGKQGCGTGTQISGSSSRHLNFWLWLQRLEVLGPTPERVGPLKVKNHCVICTTRLPNKLCLWNRNPNSRLQLQPSKLSSAPQPSWQKVASRLGLYCDEMWKNQNLFNR